MFTRFVPIDRYVLVDPGLNPIARRRNQARHDVGAWATMLGTIAGGYAAFFAGNYWALGAAVVLGALEWATAPAVVRTPPYMAWVHDLPTAEAGAAFALLRAREQLRLRMRVVRRHREEGEFLYGPETDLVERFEGITKDLYALRGQP
jgi:hypothetical protein